MRENDRQPPVSLYARASLDQSPYYLNHLALVRTAGLEPTLPEGKQILSLHKGRSFLRVTACHVPLVRH